MFNSNYRIRDSESSWRENHNLHIGLGGGGFMRTGIFSTSSVKSTELIKRLMENDYSKIINLLLNADAVIIFHVLKHLPFDALKTTRLVCKKFWEIIDNISIGGGNLLKQRFSVRLFTTMIRYSGITNNSLLIDNNERQHFALVKNLNINIHLRTSNEIDELYELLKIDSLCLRNIKTIIIYSQNRIRNCVFEDLLELIYSKQESLKELTKIYINQCLTVPNFLERIKVIES